MRMQPKKIIITGASSGIGNAVALHFAKLGHFIIGVGRNETRLAQLKNAYPDNISIVVADITKAHDRMKIKNALMPDEKNIYLINSAGIAQPQLLNDLTEESWDAQLDINLKAPVFLIKLLRNHLAGGRIFNISSGAAYAGVEGLMAYGASKTGLSVLRKYLNLELAEDKIKCGSLRLGSVDTPMQEKIRHYSPAQFPMATTLKHLFEQHALLLTENVAKFIVNILLITDDETFAKQEWHMSMQKS